MAVKLTQQELDHFYDQQMASEAKKALSAYSVFWDGIQWFIDWLRSIVRTFIITGLATVPFVGTWASRVGVTVSEFLFTVLGTLTHFLRLVFTAPEMWQKAHESAVNAWNANEANGHLAQCYAYGRKMAAYFLELIKQCTERAIRAHGLDVTEEERKEISEALDELLYRQSFGNVSGVRFPIAQ